MNAAAIQPYALFGDQECEKRIERTKEVLGAVVNRVLVPDNTAELARIALNRMLEVSP